MTLPIFAGRRDGYANLKKNKLTNYTFHIRNAFFLFHLSIV